MNAKVGKDIWTGIAVGIRGLHYASNDNRTLLINYAVYQCMVLWGTLLPHGNMHVGTWNGSDDKELLISNTAQTYQMCKLIDNMI